MGRLKDLTNIKFGKLTVQKRVGSNQYRKRLWLCQCECGNTIVSTTGDLTSGNTKSCGCLRVLFPNAKMSFNDYDIVGDTIKFYDKLHNNACIVSSCDYDKINKYHWHKSTSNGYWYTWYHLDDNKRKKMELHRVILNTVYCAANTVVDHIDRNKDNNTRDNLRIVDYNINSVNKTVRNDNISNVTGVCKYKNKWQAHIQYHGRQKNLGVFNNINDAIVARLNAEKEWYGDIAPQKCLFLQYGIVD